MRSAALRAGLRQQGVVFFVPLRGPKGPLFHAAWTHRSRAQCQGSWILVCSRRAERGAQTPAKRLNFHAAWTHFLQPAKSPVGWRRAAEQIPRARAALGMAAGKGSRSL